METNAALAGTWPFPVVPRITFRDGLGAFLGAGEGLFTYSFEDVVKLSGHACPTAAGAFLLVVRAMEELYPGQIPERGEIRVVVPGRVEEGVNGPMGQIFSLLTGAAAENGFRGLGGRFVRRGLLAYVEHPRPEGFVFQRLDTKAAVTLLYSPEAIPPLPGMGGDLQALLMDRGDAVMAQRFANSWRDRVVRILEDGGKSTVRKLQ